MPAPHRLAARDSGDRLLVNDPLSGEQQLWSKEEFEAKWSLLGRRAISA